MYIYISMKLYGTCLVEDVLVAKCAARLQFWTKQEALQISNSDVGAKSQRLFPGVRGPNDRSFLGRHLFRGHMLRPVHRPRHAGPGPLSHGPTEVGHGGHCRHRGHRGHGGHAIHGTSAHGIPGSPISSAPRHLRLGIWFLTQHVVFFFLIYNYPM